MSALLAAAAVADLVAVGVHGVIGHRWLSAQLAAVTLPESKLFGDADVGRRVLWVSWHSVTALFAVAAVTLLAMAAGAVEHNAALLRFISAVHAAVIAVGGISLLPRPDALLGRVPPVFVVCMTTVTVASWLAS